MTEEQPDVSIIIPAYNEAGRLPRTLEKLVTFLSTQRWLSELVLSDDGSTDDTIGKFIRGAGGLPVTVVRSESNRGKGHAVRLGMLTAHGKIRVMLDADGSMPAEELSKLVEPILIGSAQIVIGSRYLKGGRARGQPTWRRAWGRFTRAVVKRGVISSIEDTQCGYKAFTAPVAYEIFSRSTINGWAFDLEVLSLAQYLEVPVREVSVEWTDNARSRIRATQALSGIRQIVVDALRVRSNFRRGLYGRRGVALPDFNCSGQSPMQV